MTAMVDGWRNYAQTERDEVEDTLIEDAVRATQEEINDYAFDRTPDDNDGSDEFERMEDWEGHEHPDEEYLDGRDETGDYPNGEAAELRAENAQLRNAVAQYEQHFAPQKPDQFADPDGHEQWMLAQMRGQGGVYLPPQSYGQQLPNKPDMFAEPERHEQWMLAESARRVAVEQQVSNHIQSSFRDAHERYGHEFVEAYNAINSLDTRIPGNKAVVDAVLYSSNPGKEAMLQFGTLHARDQMDRKMGGQGFLPRRQVSKFSWDGPPKTREEADERSIAEYGFSNDY